MSSPSVQEKEPVSENVVLDATSSATPAVRTVSPLGAVSSAISRAQPAIASAPESITATNNLVFILLYFPEINFFAIIQIDGKAIGSTLGEFYA